MCTDDSENALPVKAYCSCVDFLRIGRPKEHSFLSGLEVESNGSQVGPREDQTARSRSGRSPFLSGFSDSKRAINITYPNVDL